MSFKFEVQPMKTTLKWVAGIGAAAVAAALLANAAPNDSDVKNVVTGQSAFVSYKDEKPGTFRKITVADLPKPYATEGVSNGPKVVAMPEGAWPKAPEGFKVERYAEKLDEPREIRTAPNGDLFVSESNAGKVLVFRGITADGKPQQQSTFVSGLKNNFGIAFYPLGSDPHWIYLANTGSVVRYPYKNGDLTASGPAETVIKELPAGGGHWTRDPSLFAGWIETFCFGRLTLER